MAQRELLTSTIAVQNVPLDLMDVPVVAVVPVAVLVVPTADLARMVRREQ